MYLLAKSTLVKTFLLLLLLFSCRTKGGESITILIPDSVSSLPFMQLDGELIHGKKINIKKYTDHMTAFLLFDQGNAELIVTGFSIGHKSFLKKKQTILVATPIWGVSSLLTMDPSLHSLKDFHNKQILVPFAGSPLDLQLRTLIQAQHLATTINISYAGIQQSVQLLLTRKTDGICIPEPLASQLVIDHKANRVFLFAEEWQKVNHGESRTPQVSLFTKQTFAIQNNAFLKDLVHSLQKSIKKIHQNPDQVTQEYAPKLHLENTVLKTAIQTTIFVLPSRLESIKLTTDYLHATNEPIPNENFYFSYE